MGKERKLLLLVLEGGTDETAFSKALENLINSFDIGVKIRCKVCRHDITISDEENNNNFTFAEATEVDERIKKSVKMFLDENHLFTEKDIFAICSFHDLDACYCNNSALIHHQNDVTYDLENKLVLCKDVLHMQERNEIKRVALDILIFTETLIIKNRRIPYKPFYYSINLEHLLANDPNVLTLDEKKAIAQSFRFKHYKDPKRFLDFLSQANKLSDGAVASWDEKFLYKHPFDRYSNLIDILGFIICCAEKASSHPGKYLSNYMALSSIDVNEFSNRSGIDAEILNKILNKEININNNLARQLSLASGISAETWINIQKRYDDKEIK